MMIDRVTESHNNLADQAAPLRNRATEQASVLAQRGVDAVREGSRQVRDQALRASDGTLHYVRQEPVKSILIAAAVGATLMALLSRWGGLRERR
jgi:ElaB/YqjD/DUF883 family membrane-anchored ribosome-binding protein